MYGNYVGGKPVNTGESIDGAMFDEVAWVSALINGKGRYRDIKTGKTLNKKT